MTDHIADPGKMGDHELGDALAPLLGLELRTVPDHVVAEWGAHRIQGDELVSWPGVGLIVEAMRERGWCVEMQVGQYGDAEASVYSPNMPAGGMPEGWSDDRFGNIPRAVCEAAYQALEKEISNGASE